jgi:CRISPR-associated protein Cas5d
MKDRPPLVSLKAWGDYACMTRPELKAERVSYPVLTPSAARGILESIFYEPQMSYLIHEIGVIKRGRWFSFRRNEVSKVLQMRAAARAMEGAAPLEPIRAGGGAEDGTQRGMLALANVSYLITAEIRLTSLAQPPRDSLDKYRDLFMSRAARGKCFQRPYLGCREFAADFEYVEAPADIALGVSEWPTEEHLGMMLYDVFDPRRRTTGIPLRPEPVFFKDARLVNARLDCHPDRVALVPKPGGLD